MPSRLEVMLTVRCRCGAETGILTGVDIRSFGAHGRVAHDVSAHQATFTLDRAWSWVVLDGFGNVLPPPSNPVEVAAHLTKKTGGEEWRCPQHRGWAPSDFDRAIPGRSWEQPIPFGELEAPRPSLPAQAVIDL